MGAVWRAEHIDLGTPAAVKLIDETFAQSPEALTRFRREAQAAASLRSANVVQILDYGVDGDTPYIAMELLEGESLADRIERQGRLDPDECAGIMLQVSKALARAHEQGIVHRDLKPDNVFLSRDGDDVIAKVLDFGIAKRTGVLQTSSDMATRTGSLMGTPYYMSPEQASGRRQVDHRTDIWAFGVIACECLTGRRPFDDSNLGGLLLSICTENPPAPSQVAPVPLGFDTWFARCTVKDPAGRFESIREAAVELCRSVGSDATASRFSASRGNFAPQTSVVNQAGPTPWGDSRTASVATPGAVMMPLGGPNPGTLNPATIEPGARRRPSMLLLLSGAIALFGVVSVAIAFVARELPKQKESASNSLTTDASSTSPRPMPSSPSTNAVVTVAPVEPTMAASSVATSSPTPGSSVVGSNTSPPLPPKPRTVARPPTARPANPRPVAAPATRAGEPQQAPRIRPQDRLERDLGF